MLDEAVARGQLKNINRTITLPVQGSDEAIDLTMHYYCQPGQEEKMHVAILCNEGKYKELTPEQQKIEWEDILGYRKRDRIFFEHYQNLPERAIRLCIEWNAQA